MQAKSSYQEKRRGEGGEGRGEERRGGKGREEIKVCYNGFIIIIQTNEISNHEGCLNVCL